MQKIKLENVSFNKLKEFTSLGSKKNTTIKGKFTLIGEYELLTKDGGDSVTNKELAAQIKELRQIVLEGFAKINARIDNLVIKNNLIE